MQPTTYVGDTSLYSLWHSPHHWRKWEEEDDDDDESER